MNEEENELEKLEQMQIALLQEASKYYGDIARIAQGDIEDTKFDTDMIKLVFNAYLGTMHHYSALGKITIGEEDK